MPEKKRCSFCNRPANEVKTLIAGQDGDTLICNKCVIRAAETIEGHATREATEEKPLQKPTEIKAFLDQYIIGQETAKIDVAIAVYEHYKRREAVRAGIDLGDVEIKKGNMLLPGPTGSGKTEIARTIARMLGVPFHVADASRMTQSGYVGDDVESMIQGLIENAEHDIERAQWGIIVLDEMDKVSRKSGKDGMAFRDISGEGVQQALLKIIEGSKIAIPRGMNQKQMAAGMQAVDVIDTENILFLCTGSFAGIEDVVERRLNKGSTLGFGASRRKVDLDLTEAYSKITEEDILEFGVIPELMGRLPILTTTLPLTEKQLVQILTEPKSALIKQYQALYRLDGIDLQFDEDALLAIGKEAKSRPTGARALRSIVAKLLRDYSYELPTNDEISGLRITAEYVDSIFPGEDGEAKEGVKPLLIKGKRKAPKVVAQA